MGVRNCKSSMSWSLFSLCPGLIMLIMLLIVVDVGVSQNCGCSSGDCCSKYGYCGTGGEYCGNGCKEGPCYPGGGGRSESSLITVDDFLSMVGGAGAANVSGCEGKGFYNYSDFIDAANAFEGFGTSGSSDVQKRELAAFFANAAHETGGFCYIEEQNPPINYCDSSNSTQYPCKPGKSYHGRGPLQLSWNYNYGAAGNNLGFDGLNNPETVATDPNISWKTAVWFWMMDSNCHKAITSGEGFGATIRAINAMECDGNNSAAVESRVAYYQNYSTQLNVDAGQNLRC